MNIWKYWTTCIGYNNKRKRLEILIYPGYTKGRQLFKVSSFNLTFTQKLYNNQTHERVDLVQLTVVIPGLATTKVPGETTDQRTSSHVNNVWYRGGITACTQYPVFCNVWQFYTSIHTPDLQLGLRRQYFCQWPLPNQWSNCVLALRSNTLTPRMLYLNVGLSGQLWWITGGGSHIFMLQLVNLTFNYRKHLLVTLKL